MTNPLTITVYNSAGTEVATGSATTLTDKYQQDVRLVSQFITNGALPSRGSITIQGEQSYSVTFFVGSNLGFSMNVYEANAAP